MFLIVLPCSSICCVGILCQTMSYAIQMMFSVQVLIMFVIKCSPVGDGWGGYFRNSSKSRISCRTNITFNRLMMTSWDSWYAFIQSWTEDVRFCFNKFSYFSWKYLLYSTLVTDKIQRPNGSSPLFHRHMAGTVNTVSVHTATGRNFVKFIQKHSNLLSNFL